MRLRPRYSLLTLLILTALVAGGVKLWYGPHHVVERIERGDVTYVREYNRTRSLNGAYQVQGPVVRRQYRHQQIDGMTIEFQRHGKIVAECILDIVEESRISRISNEERLAAIRKILSDTEFCEWRRVIDVEKQRQPGSGWKWEEFFNDKP